MGEQNYYLYKDIKLGYGNFDLPPILIGTLFYQGETIVDRSNPEIFDEEKAKKRIIGQITLSPEQQLIR